MGINTIRNVVGSVEYQCIESAMRYDAFDGIPGKNNFDIIYNACKRDCFGLLHLIYKYRMKNKDLIVNAINYVDPQTRERPIHCLLMNRHCNTEWLKLLLSFGDIKEFECKLNFEMISLTGKKVTALQVCEKRKKKNKDWVTMIEKAMNVKQQSKK